MDMFVLGLIAGIAFSALVVHLIVKYVERKLLAELARLEADADKSVESNTIVATVEVADNRYFCYNKDTKQFICYGNTVSEISDNFRKRFPNHGLTLVSEDPAVLEQLDQQLALKDNSAV
jgi:hypothetical protein